LLYYCPPKRINLVIDGGTLRYLGDTATTDRGLTIKLLHPK